MGGFARRATRVATDRGGATAVIAAIAIPPLLMAAGASIDLTRALVVKSRLEMAIDAAGLAVGSSQGTNDQLQAVMKRHFDANYPATKLGVPATPVMTITGDVINISATADVDTTLMRLAGFNTLTVAAKNQITREINGLEVVMVLDNTGSMSGSKLVSLKTAATDLTNILFGSQTVATKLKIGVVPFVTTVNIGTGNSALISNLGASPSYPASAPWKGCIEERPSPHDVSDEDAATGGKWPRWFWPKTLSPTWPAVSNQFIANITGPNRACPTAITPLTSAKPTVINAINAMLAYSGSGTQGNVGMVWGWRVISPGSPFTEGLPYDTTGWKKAIIMMTDGENNFISSEYTAYGRLSEGRLGTTNATTARAVIDSRFLQVCTAVKNLHVQVYTVLFETNDATAQQVVHDCATSPAQFFNSPTEADLEAAFHTIGTQLSNLRLSQ